MDFAKFTFVFTLAAVINGLGIVRWLTAVAEVLRRRQSLQVQYSAVFISYAAFQFLLHILLWWSLWGIRTLEAFDFLDYLFLLSGPLIIFLASSVLVPEVDDGKVDLEAHYRNVYQVYATLMLVAWLWTILFWPVLGGFFAPIWPFTVGFFLLAGAQRFTKNLRIHRFLAAGYWLLLAGFIFGYALELGAVAESVNQVVPE